MRIFRSLLSFFPVIAILATISPQALADEIITCKSHNYKYNHCDTDSRPDYAKVHKQRSNTDCKRGRNWDYDRGGIWVDDGCAADFLIESDDNNDDRHDSHNNHNSNQHNYSDSYNGGDGETMYGITITRDIKRNSNDYKSYISGSLQLCARQCSNDNRCQSFNYGKAKKDCHLKDNVVDGVHNNTVVSGVK